MNQNWVNFFIGLGASIVTVGFFLWIERQRRPVITMHVGDTSRITEDDPLKRPHVTFVRVAVRNEPTPKWIAWVYDRNPALSCRAWITFSDLVDKKADDSRMSGRWAATDEPEVQVIQSPAGRVIRLANIERKVDIAPNETANLDIAVKFEDDGSCFGWCNESYLHDWRHPEWQLPTGEQLITVSVRTGGRQYDETFRFHNTVTYDDCRLEGPTG